jgi:hypothetical protein
VFLPNRAPLKLNLCPRALFIFKIFMWVAAKMRYRSKKTADAGTSGMVTGKPPKLAFCGAYGGFRRGPPCTVNCTLTDGNWSYLQAGLVRTTFRSVTMQLGVSLYKENLGKGCRSNRCGSHIYQTLLEFSLSGAGDLTTLVSSMNSLEQTTDDGVVDSTPLRQYRGLIGIG